MTPKVGRNDLCPCGSGKKHKNCCLKEKQSESAPATKRKFTARVINAGGQHAPTAQSTTGSEQQQESTRTQNKALHDYDKLMERSFGHAFRSYEKIPPKVDNPDQYLEQTESQ